MAKPTVFFLPGGIMPADSSYGGLIGALAGSIKAFPKDLAVYDADTPPAEYSLDLEVESLLSAADEVGVDRFNLVGYSVGGTIALLCAEQHGQRLASLALFEPTVIDSEQTERILIAGADPRQQSQMMLRTGATPPSMPPPSGSPPPWMAKRPAAFVPIMKACRDAAAKLGPGLRRFEGRVLYVLGADSNPEFFDPEKIRALLPQTELVIFAGCSHPSPPFRVEPEDVATRLRSFWT
jgi:pimeloyl-ACP methyl ester carboxylesterase